MSIEGKVALVTGATRGIGKAIALELGKQGAVVVGTATSDGGAESISAYLSEAGVTGKGVKLNVADSDSIESVIKAVQDEFGAIVILVNNAGITRDNIMLRMKDDEWDDVINTNLSSVYRLVKTCLRGMTKARWGRIISISSVVASMGNAGQANYAAAKSGMEGFTRALAREIGSRNITVNCVAPGFIDTDMTSGLAEEHKNALQSQIPMNRLGRPEEIAAVVGFLASEGAGYVTGESIQVNGGMYMN
ncbi:3-oxoacyl-ACP reductase FabG [Neptunomonas phycophila]|jgi:3-oxoacyl-[acyl-carrier protein] reductase|uniref:3-oxoacyl-[acyl-carrier-protein] reductase n=1 Tax=Neptunomonas phycophila TaxID=1572645 RepID=A0AAW7XCQ3_9GAMM|nr:MULTISPECIES: 3-oxoacyl-ACP reductase FabG [Neptunomonas]MBT3146180.1 3-oxoacyl-ACP reductase FabG [Neptunomonas phycophila]MDN2659644.1 3-oxoacyl-ACP reductase FabG [Neptunomonas sp. CHC150]MDO6452186.1 3-oxoacyl-ACP reductase FabG [Neptunomonas phycophila]MDO6466739.1 3-oxoacyl-ACP reductase FabG [Neptunomonas phycophila]MDO6783150.1 3-oxoacyl-ACP reductase FabG [Neptunomonas phycophila]